VIQGKEYALIIFLRHYNVLVDFGRKFADILEFKNIPIFKTVQHPKTLIRMHTYAK
jgi:hypothetical protein